LRRRLRALTAQLRVADSELLADRLHIAIVGTFAVGGMYPSNGPAGQLRALADDLLTAAEPRRA
jgi:hypothetical protein